MGEQPRRWEERIIELSREPTVGQVSATLPWRRFWETRRWTCEWCRARRAGRRARGCRPASALLQPFEPSEGEYRDVVVSELPANLMDKVIEDIGEGLVPDDRDCAY